MWTNRKDSQQKIEIFTKILVLLSKKYSITFKIISHIFCVKEQFTVRNDFNIYKTPKFLTIKLTTKAHGAHGNLEKIEVNATECLFS